MGSLFAHTLWPVGTGLWWTGMPWARLQRAADVLVGQRTSLLLFSGTCAAAIWNLRQDFVPAAFCLVSRTGFRQGFLCWVKIVYAGGYAWGLLLFTSGMCSAQ